MRLVRERSADRASASPFSGLEIDGDVQTPSVGFAHETAHVLASFYLGAKRPRALLLQSTGSRKNLALKKSNNRSEDIVLKNIESPIVKGLNLPIRKNQNVDEAVTVSCPTCTK